MIFLGSVCVFKSHAQSCGFVGKPAEETVSEQAAGGDGDGGKFNIAADIAEGVDVRISGRREGEKANKRM